MSIPAFTQGYPPDGSSLGETKSVIRDNLDGTFLTLGVDHINNNGQPGMNPAGYHTIIHQVTQTNVSTLMPTGYNQVFSGVPGNLIVNGVTTPAIPPTDTQLYSLTGAGQLAQLTGYNISSNNGYAWAGGILFQWGVVATTGTSGNIDFTASPNIKFPTAVYNVQLTPSTTNTTTFPIYNVLEASLTTSGFNYYSNIANAKHLFWFAIGK